jgi:tape measure domain-containing protein
MAVVEGLSAFIGDMGKIGSAIEGVNSPVKFLGDAFGFLGDIMGKFASWVGDVLTYTLGNLLSDAIEGVIALISQMIDKTIEAGNEFQTLTLRLNGMNLNDLIKSGKDYNAATTESIKLTKEQLNWLQTLAMATPYDNTDISNVYSLARSYGFADGEARGLTGDIADFASAMGLTNQHMERIVVNFGQMKARGKITSTEIRDLARGAFLPLDDVLGRVAKSMGVTTVALQKMISKPGAGVPYQKFIEAFQAMIDDEPRFMNASVRMARTFKYATANVMDLVTSLGGLNIVTPILDVLGGKIADFMDQFVGRGDAGIEFTKLGNEMVKQVQFIGEALSGIVDEVIQFFFPDTAAMGEGLVGLLKSIATFLMVHKEDIVQGIKDIYNWFLNLGQTAFFKEGGILDKLKDLYHYLFDVNEQTGENNVQNFVNNQLIPFKDNLSKALEPFGKFVANLFTMNERTEQSKIQDLADAFGDLSEALTGSFVQLLEDFGLDVKNSHVDVGLLTQALKDLAKWIRDNQPTIETFVKVVAGFLIIQTITSLVWSLISSLLVIGITIAIVSASFTAFTAVILVVGVALAGVIVIGNALGLGLTILTSVISTTLTILQNNIDTFKKIIQDALYGIRTLDFYGAGKKIVTDLANGIIANIQAAVNAAAQLGNEVKKALEAIFSSISWPSWAGGGGSGGGGGGGSGGTGTTAAQAQSQAAARAAAAAKAKASGKAVGTSFTTGMETGIRNTSVVAANASKAVVQTVWAAATKYGEIASPSKLFMRVGANLVKGMAEGITSSTGLAVGAMKNSMAAISMPAMTLAPSAISNTYQSNSAYNLSIIKSGGSSENIIADFRMMESLG